MPLVDLMPYRTSIVYKNMHINTLTAAVFRKVKDYSTTKERVETNDGDFFDVEWSKVNSKKLLICLHGLEGNATKPYMHGMMKRFNFRKYDTVGLHHRGCSGDDNRKLKSYHTGFYDDLEFFVNKINDESYYNEIVICGFSAGGNIALKYAGYLGSNLPKIVKKIIAISSPIDVEACSIEFMKPANYIYTKNFLFTLKRKAQHKHDLYPGTFDINKVWKSKNFNDFDAAYTAPVWGFESANDYWAKSSSLSGIKNVTIPILLINALDDSFLSPSCYPYDLMESMPNFYLATPKYGGHLGFMKRDKNGYLWTEKLAARWVNQ
jgi:uncharacterized protein